MGSAIVQSLREQGFKNIITKGREELDLLDYKAVENFFANNEIEYVFLAAAKVGGIFANDKYRADFIYQNLSIQNNVIFNAYKFVIKSKWSINVLKRQQKTHVICRKNRDIKKRTQRMIFTVSRDQYCCQVMVWNGGRSLVAHLLDRGFEKF